MEGLEFLLKTNFMQPMDHLVKELKKAISLEFRPSFDGDLDYSAPMAKADRRAAVLILLNDFGEEPTITLTKRTEALRQHSGQVAFPGGRIDKNDASAWDAALRETHEEIGLPNTHPLEHIGALSTHITITGYEVKPFVAVNKLAFPYRAEKGEVAEIFEIPYSLLHVDNFEIGAQDWKGSKRRFFVLPFEGYYIWGATARMLHQLASRLEYVR